MEAQQLRAYVRRRLVGSICRALALPLLIGIVALATGCGSSGTATAHHAAALTTRSTATAPASDVNASTASPQLLYCLDVGSGSELVALSQELERIAVVPVASFADACNQDSTIYSYSTDLSKQATANGSTDTGGGDIQTTEAGYLPTNDAAFVNLSGQASNSSYTENVVANTNPYFDPKTGELWWIRESHLWSVPVSGGSPRQHGLAPDYGNGISEAFLPNGDPIPRALASAPDGKLLAAYPKEGAKLAVGMPSAFTASCLNKAFDAGDGGGYDFTRSPCPGLLAVSYKATPNRSPCEKFVGFVSDSRFVCAASTESGTRFDLIGLTISGSSATAKYLTTLTPPTQMTLHGSQVSPDGKTLWYWATRNAMESGSQTNLYVVPTTAVTTNPKPASLTRSELLTANGDVIGWRWNGHLLAAIY